MQNILHLTIKKQWFDMIASGEKREEYREIKPHWTSRLYQPLFNDFVHFDLVVFHNGYSPVSPTICLECKGISKGLAKPEWSDNWKGEVYVIALGEIINHI